MTRPKRIQLRRTKGWRKPEGAIVVARSTIYGNPYRIDDTIAVRCEPPATDFTVSGLDLIIDRPLAVVLFRAYLDQNPGWRDQQARELAGHDLACWCPLDQPCHADVLLEIANHPPAEGHP
ncbi:MAG TPA: DUF4326 domain-containing protein [Jatrophihabitantaceae bacterium]|jgi:hypothetical protein